MMIGLFAAAAVYTSHSRQRSHYERAVLALFLNVERQQHDLLLRKTLVNVGVAWGDSWRDSGVTRCVAIGCLRRPPRR